MRRNERHLAIAWRPCGVCMAAAWTRNVESRRAPATRIHVLCVIRGVHRGVCLARTLPRAPQSVKA